MLPGGSLWLKYAIYLIIGYKNKGFIHIKV